MFIDRVRRCGRTPSGVQCRPWQVQVNPSLLIVHNGHCTPLGCGASGSGFCKHFTPDGVTR
jgi:hypothetical protein